MEHLEGIHLFARRDELQRFVDHRTDGDGCTAAGVAVELREHHAVVIQSFVELSGSVHGILSRHGIHHEEGLGGLDGSLDGRYLLHHRFVHRQAAGRIDDDGVDVLATGIFYGVLRYLHRVLVALFGVDLHAYLLAEYLQLFDGCRPVDVACDEQDAAASLALQQVGELAGEGGLTGTLQAGDEDDGRSAVEIDVRGRTAHEQGKFVTDYLGHHLPRLDGGQHVGAEGLLLYLVGEGLGYLIVHVGVDERAAYLLERFGNVDFGNPSFALQYLERPLQPVG